MESNEKRSIVLITNAALYAPHLTSDQQTLVARFVLSVKQVGFVVNR